MYGPAISGATGSYSGSALFQRLSQSFGYLNKQGYCAQSTGQCHQFPVVLGEFGSRLEDPHDAAQASTACSSGWLAAVTGILMFELADCIGQPVMCPGSRSTSDTAAGLCFCALTGTCHRLLQTAHSWSSHAETRAVLLQFNDMVSWMNVGDGLHNPVAGWFW